MTKKPFHFYASSLGTWRVNTDIAQLIEDMKRERLNFAIWKVPGHKDEPYQIREFAPVVEGRVYLGTYTRNGNKWETLTEDVSR